MAVISFMIQAPGLRHLLADNAYQVFEADDFLP